MKAVAVHAIFLIAAITIFLFFLTVIFFEWIDWTDKSANLFSCNAKKTAFCSDWRKTGTDPGWWETKDPDCDETVKKPTSLEDC